LTVDHHVAIAWSPAAARTLWTEWPDRPDDLVVVPFDYRAIAIQSVDPATCSPVWRTRDRALQALVDRATRSISIVLPGTQEIEWAASLLADQLGQAGHPVTTVLRPAGLSREALLAALAHPSRFHGPTVEREWRSRAANWLVGSFVNPVIKRAGISADLDLDGLAALATLAAANDRDLQALDSFRKNETEWPVVDALSACAMAPDLPAGQAVDLHDRLVDAGLLACWPEVPDSFVDSQIERFKTLVERAKARLGRPGPGPGWLVDPERDLAGIPPDCRPAYLAVWRRAFGVAGPVPAGRLGHGSLPHVWTAARSCMGDRRWWRALASLRASGLVAGWSWPAVTPAGRVALAAVRTSWGLYVDIPAQGPQVPAFARAIEHEVLHGRDRSFLQAVVAMGDRASTNKPHGPPAGRLCRCGLVPDVLVTGRDAWLDCRCGQRVPADVTDGIVWPVRQHDHPGWCRVHGVEVLEVSVVDNVKTVRCKRCRQESA
jgi:hypothetical protein